MDQKTTKENKRANPFIRLVITLVVLVGIIFLIIYLLRGEHMVQGKYPENVKYESVTCEAENLAYPLVSTPEDIPKSLEVKMIFKGTTELRSLSLIYKAEFSSNEEMNNVATHANVELYEAFAAAGYGVDKFNNKFSRYGNQMMIQLYADGSEIDNNSAHFMMIDTVGTKSRLPSDLAEYKRNYERKGFVCNSTVE